MIVVDSSVWISHFADVVHPEVRILRSIPETDAILMGELILVEVLKGARSERDARHIETALALFDSATMLDRATAKAAALNYRRLREIGITPRNTVDLIVGTFCIEHGHQLLHRDRDFGRMQQLGLQFYPA